METISNQKQKIISIVGSTSTGKSLLAVKIATKLNAEIISADSRQVYKEFNIATAKATSEEMGGIKHYLIDVLNPNEEFSAGVFVELATAAITEIRNKGKIPILVGGTGLYLRMLLDGFDMPKSEPDLELRANLEEKLKAEGSVSLYNMLCELDAEFAKKLHPNDSYKIMRSIEILKQTNKPMSESRGVFESQFDVLKIGLNAQNRDFLYDRINLRVDKMLEAGLVDEAANLYKKYPESKAYQNTIGYQEFIPYFENKISLEEAVSKIKQNTRRYAKRQLTWFRAQNDIHWFNIDELSFDIIENNALKLCEEFFA